MTGQATAAEQLPQQHHTMPAVFLFPLALYVQSIAETSCRTRRSHHGTNAIRYLFKQCMRLLQTSQLRSDSQATKKEGMLEERMLASRKKRAASVLAATRTG